MLVDFIHKTCNYLLCVLENIMNNKGGCPKDFIWEHFLGVLKDGKSMKNAKGVRWDKEIDQ